MQSQIQIYKHQLFYQLKLEIFMQESHQTQRQLSRQAESLLQNKHQNHTKEQLTENKIKNIFDDNDEAKNEFQQIQNRVIQKQSSLPQHQNQGIQDKQKEIKDQQKNESINKQQQEKSKKIQNISDSKEMQQQLMDSVEKQQNQNQLNSQYFNKEQSSKQHYNNQKNMSIDVDQQKSESNEQQNSYELEGDEKPFLWGQQQEQHNEVQRKTYTHLYLNNNLASNLQIYGNHILEHIKQQSKVQQSKLQQSNTQTYEAPIVKVKRKNPTDSYDIWVDLKKSMELKPKNISKKKKLQEKELVKSNSSHLLKKQVEKQNNRNYKLQRQDSVKKQINPQSYNNISILSKQISGKVKEWMQQQKDIERRRHEKITKLKQKQQMQVAKQIQNLQKKKKAEIKLRVRQISQRLQAKKLKVKLAEKQWSTVKNTKKTKKQKQLSKRTKSLKVLKQAKNQQKLPQIIEPPVFSMHWNRKDSSQLEKVKAVRRKKFDEKVKDMPIKININKKIDLLIKADKEINPSKYQILSKKGLTDYEIYENFKQFKIMTDPKKVGKRYLQQLRDKYKQHDLERYMSNRSTKSIESLHYLQKSSQI